MVSTKIAAFGMCMWTTTLVVAASASAQSQTCADGSSLWSVGSAAHTTSVAISIEASLAAAGTTDDVASVVAAVLPALVPRLSPVLLPTPAAEDVQWCVDSNDPRCSPDPAGAPATHLGHAGDVGQTARAIMIAPAAVHRLPRSHFSSTSDASGHRGDLERPPQRG